MKSAFGFKKNPKKLRTSYMKAPDSSRTAAAAAGPRRPTTACSPCCGGSSRRGTGARSRPSTATPPTTPGSRESSRASSTGARSPGGRDASSSATVRFSYNSGHFLAWLYNLQGDPSGRRLHLLTDLVVPMSALFCLCTYKSGKMEGMPCRQYGCTFKSKLSKYIR